MTFVGERGSLKRVFYNSKTLLLVVFALVAWLDKVCIDQYNVPDGLRGTALSRAGGPRTDNDSLASAMGNQERHLTAPYVAATLSQFNLLTPQKCTGSEALAPQLLETMLTCH